MRKLIDLDGTWQLRWNDGVRGDKVARLTPATANVAQAFDAAVPGAVHLDLLKAGLIQEPAVGLNSLAARWVEECTWFYRRTFKAPALAAGARAHLVFETLDLAAVIYLNGREVGRHANAFYPCRLDVTGQLRAGVNVLVVELESGLGQAAEKPFTGYIGSENRLHKRHWLRQTQSTFGWDWSLRLLNVGIRGSVRVEIVSVARFDRLVALATVADDLRTGTVTARVFVEGLDDKIRPGRLRMRIVETGQTVTKDVEIKPGLNPVEAQLAVASPRLWWPVGHGTQPRYTVEAAMTVAGRTIGRATRKIGFRHVRVDQSPHPEKGRFFIITINHKPIFCKGGNFVPADPILARLDRARYTTLVNRALENNFNCLRVWGGGLYESDDFYELCDAKGILVWQEFIFACGRYPATDEQFYHDALREAAHQVRRLASHPSLIVWCGNNENEWGYHSWGFDRGVVLPDHALYHHGLPQVLQREDGTRYYQPSSPYSPDGLHPNADEIGDQHPWSIGFGDTDFRKYRAMICRFPNEGGILGATSLPTVRACLEPGAKHTGTFAWEMHDNSVNYWAEKPFADAITELWLGRRVSDMSLEDYVYFTGLLQGEGLAEYIRNFRRRMFDCASAIFWMYNDCWPMVRSWTTVDYYLRRTPSFHPVRRANQPRAVFVTCDDRRVQIHGVNEGPAWKGTIRYGIFALAGGRPMDRTVAVELPANASTRVATFELAALNKLGMTTHGAFAVMSDGGGEVSRDRLFLPLFKEMRWPRAAVKVQRSGGKVIFTSRTFAWRVCLDLDGERRLPDNFFDILPGIPVTLDWPARLGAPKILRIGNSACSR